MDKYGSVGQVGLIIALFVGIIFATTLLTGGIYENIGTVTNKVDVANQTLAYAATTVLRGQAATNLVVTNATSGTVIASGNYSVVNYDVSTGTLRTYITNLTSRVPYPNINVSYTYEPLGYSTDAGARTMTTLIAVFSVLAVVAFVVYKTYEEGLFDHF